MSEKVVVLAKVRAGQNPGEPQIMSIEMFAKQFNMEIIGETVCYNPDVINWAKYGRIGSRWQIVDDMYIRMYEGDDLSQYYKPEQEVVRPTAAPWSGGGCSDCDTKGNCDDDGCAC